MFRALRLVFLAAVAVVLIALAMANRDIVTLRALPADAGDFLGYSWSIQVPLFAVVFAGILLGLLVGFVWEWMREYKLRQTASTASRTAAINSSSGISGIAMRRALALKRRALASGRNSDSPPSGWA